MSDLVTHPLVLAGERVEPELVLDPEPVLEPVPDPLRRPVVDPEILRGTPAVYTPQEVQELLSLLTPCRVYRQGQWVVLDLTLARLREWFAMFCEEIQDRADEQWRASGAYQRAVAQSLAEAREQAQERQHDRAVADQRERVESHRVRELIDYGLSPRDAAAQAQREFGGS